jgi:hypothetical protein
MSTHDKFAIIGLVRSGKERLLLAFRVSCFVGAMEVFVCWVTLLFDFKQFAHNAYWF